MPSKSGWKWIRFKAVKPQLALPQNDGKLDKPNGLSVKCEIVVGAL
jgi:hypothetical protein